MPILKKILSKKNILFVISGSLLITLAFLSHRYTLQIDVTANSSNTLSHTSQQLLNTLDAPVEIQVYMRPATALQQQISQLVQRYQAHKNNISLIFTDPKTDLKTTKRLNIGKQGLIVVRYQGRMEKITFLDESSLSNALLQLAYNDERWISFLTGHGERHPQGKANVDLGLFSKELARRNIKTQALPLTQLAEIPNNTALLVLTAPSVALLTGEIKLIQTYIKQGGNLLILTDPENPYLKPIMQTLGVSQTQTAIVDNSSKLYGIDDASFVLVSHYNRHPITKGLQTMTVYPNTASLTFQPTPPFFTETLLSKTPQGASPQILGLILTQNLKSTLQQRIVILGDGDFLSNTFLGNVGNLELGLRLFNWLTHNDQFIEIPIKTPNDHRLTLTPLMIGLIGFGFLGILPLGFIVIGFLIGHRRKRS
jgi:ABC-type uncharacterized transport system involved in gliding motility auxiliary subunit